MQGGRRATRGAEPARQARPRRTPASRAVGPTHTAFLKHGAPQGTGGRAAQRQEAVRPGRLAGRAPAPRRPWGGTGTSVPPEPDISTAGRTPAAWTGRPAATRV
ncbi:hypothetical protein ACVW0K_007338 [Streptomyces filamentosus]